MARVRSRICSRNPVTLIISNFLPRTGLFTDLCAGGNGIMKRSAWRNHVWLSIRVMED